MVKTAALLLSVAASGLLVPSPAWAASNLERLDSGYGADDQRVIDEYTRTWRYDIDAELERQITTAASNAIVDRALQCLDENDWSDIAAMQATHAKMAEWRIRALRANTPFSEERMKLFDDLLAGERGVAARQTLKPAIEKALGRSGSGQDLSFEIVTTLQAFVAGTDLPSDLESMKYLGSYLFFQFRQEVAADIFKGD